MQAHPEFIRAVVVCESTFGNTRALAEAGASVASASRCSRRSDPPSPARRTRS